MNLIEFNKLSYQEKWNYLFKESVKESGAICLKRATRNYYNQEVRLWDCGHFFAEVYYLKGTDEITKIEGLKCDDKRLDSYIERYNEKKRTLIRMRQLINIAKLQNKYRLKHQDDNK